MAALKISIILCASVYSITAQVLPQWNAPYNCEQPVKPGPCKARIGNYFYNSTSGDCEPFDFGGCGGNDNRFQSMYQCQQRCSCHMPPEVGRCRASIERWYYNQNKGCCEKFTYGGCGGNGNNFQSFSDCEGLCSGTESGKMKPYGVEWGSGYNRATDEVKYENYGGMFGGSGTIWLHKEFDAAKQPVSSKKIMKIFTSTRRRQVPGVQTKLNVQFVGGEGQGAGGAMGGGMQGGGAMGEGMQGGVAMGGGMQGGAMSGGMQGGAMSGGMQGGGAMGRIMQGGGAMGGGMQGGGAMGGGMQGGGAMGGGMPGGGRMGSSRVISGSMKIGGSTQSGGGVPTSGGMMTSGSFSQTGGGGMFREGAGKPIMDTVLGGSGGFVGGMDKTNIP